MTGDRPAVELQAICEVCLLPVADGDGAVWVQPPPPGVRPGAHRGGPTTVGHLLEEGDSAVWHVTHDDCGSEQASYRIEVERIRTWAAYLHWTGHLMGKDWLSDTNWDELILDSLNPTSSTPGGIRPLMLRDPGHRSVGD